MTVKRDDKNQDLADHFSRRAAYWKNIYSYPVGSHDFFHHEAIKKRKKAVLDFVEKYAQWRSLKILDCGCGTGIIMDALLQQGHQVFGIDISPDMIKEANITLMNYERKDKIARLGSVEAIDYPDQCFDLCLCIGVLEYLENDEQALRELIRVTRQNGYIVVSLPNIARITTLFDPYYYIVRVPKFLYYKIFKIKKSDGLSSHYDIRKNVTFRNNRYYYCHIYRICKRINLTVRDVSPIGYGPFTFWQREYIPRSLTYG